MLKKSAIKRIMLASIALVMVFFALYIFPQKEVTLPTKVTYSKGPVSGIYLKDKNDYVVRTEIYTVNQNNDENKALELINALIDSSSQNEYIPDGFKTYLNKNTKVLNVSLKDKILTINFNNSLLDVEKDNEIKVIEQIVYTLTELNTIEKVEILINGENLTYLKKSNIKLDKYLDRNIGINHSVSLSSIKGSKTVTVYFLGKNDDFNYYIPITYTLNNDKEKIEIIINELSASENIDSNLYTYITAGAELLDYEILENEVMLEFNNVIFNSFNKINEEVIYGIGLSIYDTYDIETTTFKNLNGSLTTFNIKNS